MGMCVVIVPGGGSESCRVQRHNSERSQENQTKQLLYRAQRHVEEAWEASQELMILSDIEDTRPFGFMLMCIEQALSLYIVGSHPVAPEVVWRDRLGGISMPDVGNLRVSSMDQIII